MPRIQCRQCSSRLSDSCMADLVGASIPERGAASTHQELLLRSQPLPRSPLRQYSSSSCSEAAAMAAADSLLTPLESCKNGVHSSWHQVVRQRQVSSGQHGHHRLWCGQPPSGAASAASRRPLPRGKRNVFGGSDKDVAKEEIGPERTFGLTSGAVVPRGAAQSEARYVDTCLGVECAWAAWPAAR